MPLRLGIEMGPARVGFALSDASSGMAQGLKLPVSEGRLSATIALGFSELLQRSARQASEIDRVVAALPMGSEGAFQSRIGLLVTRGFEQKLANGAGPEQAILTRGIDERISTAGNTLAKLEEDSVRQSASELIALQVEAVAVCLLNAHRNPDHELRVRQIVRGYNEKLPVILSHEVSSENGEDARARTTLLAARCSLGTDTYLAALADGLASAETRPPIDIMQATGERIDSNTARNAPEKLLVADTASAAAAAARIVAAAGHPDALSLNVGGGATFGTLIRRGSARVSHATEVLGHPINLPALDVRSVGGGLNAVASSPMQGMIRVSNEDIRPACLGGDGRPTVFDALVVLHRIPADALPLERDRAEASIADLARPLGVDVHRAAEGIVSIHCETLAGGLRRMASEKGIAPAALALVASGGGGPMLAGEVARIMGSGPVIVPRNAGVLGAVGCATAGKETQFSVGIGKPADVPEIAGISESVAELTGQAEAWLAAEGGGGSIGYRADMAFPGSNFRCSVGFDAEASQDARGLFHLLSDLAAENWRKRFGNTPERVPDVLSIRAVATAESATSPPPASTSRNVDAHPVPESQAQVWVGNSFKTASIFDGDNLRAGARIVGPALIRQSLTTIVVDPDMTASVDGHLNVVLNVRDGEAAS